MRISDWSSDVCSSDLAVDHEQADVGWQVGKLIPQTRPVAGRRPERRMAEVGEHALPCEPMRGGGDEYLMLVMADEPPAAEHRKRPPDDKAARAARPERREVGKEGVMPCRSRWGPS